MARTSARDRSFVDLSARVKLRVSGADRLRFLNGQLTNDVRKTSETSALEACVLNAKGKLEAHLLLHKQGDSFLLDADAALKSSLQPRLERYIIADDVQIEDVTSEFAIFHVIDGTPRNVGNVRILNADRFGTAGHDIWVGSSEAESIKSALAKDFDLCDENCAELLRIVQGIPRWGCELTNEIIPVEANLEQRCIDYDKGCYIGQETISRMKMSGQRNKELRGLISRSGGPLSSKMKLVAGEKDVGWITSAAMSGGKEIALAYIKRGFNTIGAKLMASGGEDGPVAVEVVDLPFAVIRGSS